MVGAETFQPAMLQVQAQRFASATMVTLKLMSLSRLLVSPSMYVQGMRLCVILLSFATALVRERLSAFAIKDIQ